MNGLLSLERELARRWFAGRDQMVACLLDPFGNCVMEGIFKPVFLPYGTHRDACTILERCDLFRPSREDVRPRQTRLIRNRGKICEYEINA